MPRITQQIMIMIFFCSGVPAAVGERGEGMVSVGAGWTQELRTAVCPVPLCLWWALSSTLAARRALAVLGREGHPCSCFCPGLAEPSWWPSGPHSDTGPGVGNRTDSWHCA